MIWRRAANAIDWILSYSALSNFKKILLEGFSMNDSDLTPFPPSIPDNRLMVSVAEAARLMSVPSKTIRGMIDRNELPASKVGRHLRISMAALRRRAEKS